MVGIAEVISAPFFARPLRADPFQTHWIAGIVYKLHSMTGSLLFLSCCFVFVKELMGDHIRCIQDGSDELGSQVSEEAFNSYCYITSTFTVPITNPESAQQRPYPGVAPYKSADVERHVYYQWIGYLLFLQSLSFFGPLMLHRFLQDGRAQRILQDLNNIIVYNETRTDKYGDIDVFFGDWFNRQNWWAIKLTICDGLNLINILLNIFLVDWYLDGNFFTYGPISLRYIFSTPSLRPEPHPFDDVFPKMTKCSLYTYGPSGTIQTHDALCVLNVNVLNDKIYFLLWFVFMGLALFTIIFQVVGLVIIMSRSLRKSFLCLYISPDRLKTRAHLRALLDASSYGDWLMLYMIAKNTDRVIFAETVEHIKPPNYRRDLEPLDEENQRLNWTRRRVRPSADKGQSLDSD